MQEGDKLIVKEKVYHCATCALASINPTHCSLDNRARSPAFHSHIGSKFKVPVLNIFQWIYFYLISVLFFKIWDLVLVPVFKLRDDFSFFFFFNFNFQIFKLVQFWFSIL
jgi:hypothetical protein